MSENFENVNFRGILENKSILKRTIGLLDRDRERCLSEINFELSKIEKYDAGERSEGTRLSIKKRHERVKELRVKLNKIMEAIDANERELKGNGGM